MPALFRGLVPFAMLKLLHGGIGIFHHQITTDFLLGATRTHLSLAGAVPSPCLGW